MLASRASYAPSLSSPLGGYTMPLSPDASYSYSSYEPLNVPQVPQIPQQYASPRSQSSKDEMTDSEKS
ncbi:hypothetical protein FBU31_007989 [Coemansia sp. 'formosensis']|nr:hypothetical protein FBU31_007989 [Coemansia sp. 'formosensis']